MSNIDIEKLANDILTNYDICNIPIDPIIIAKKLGINIYQAEFYNLGNETISGGIEKKDKNKVKIYVNKNDSILKKDLPSHMS